MHAFSKSTFLLLVCVLAILPIVIAAPVPIRLSRNRLRIRDSDPDLDSDLDSTSDLDSSSDSDCDSDSSCDGDSDSTSATSVDDNSSSDSSSPSPSSSSNSTSSPSSFAADSSIDVASILRAVNAATSSPVSGAKYGTGHGKEAQIYQLNVASPSGGSVYAVEADMDVDCDGPDYMCKGNDDGQKLTSYGALAAKSVPFYVLPQSFVDKNKIKGNSLGAIICDNKMYYAIMGDTNGDSPEVIGEASWLMAQTCFPTAGLDGAVGHDSSDVTYIVFGSIVPSDIDENSPTIDIGALKALGDQTMKSFKLSS